MMIYGPTIFCLDTKMNQAKVVWSTINLSPAHVMDIFYLTTTREFRNRHKELIKYYYEELVAGKEKRGYSLKAIIPWNAFLESCEYYQKLALIRAVIILTTIMAPFEIVDKGFETNEEYKNFMLYERGRYIKLCFWYES